MEFESLELDTDFDFDFNFYNNRIKSYIIHIIKGNNARDETQKKDLKMITIKNLEEKASELLATAPIALSRLMKNIKLIENDSISLYLAKIIMHQDCDPADVLDGVEFIEQIRDIQDDIILAKSGRIITIAMVIKGQAELNNGLFIQHNQELIDDQPNWGDSDLCKNTNFESSPWWLTNDSGDAPIAINEDDDLTEYCK